MAEQEKGWTGLLGRKWRRRRRRRGDEVENKDTVREIEDI